MPLDLEKAAPEAKAKGVGAPGDEIEITHAMIAAGERVLFAHVCAGYIGDRTVTEVVPEIYRAMALTSRASPRNESS